MTEFPKYLIFLLPFTMLLMFFNCLISKNIYDWVPFPKQKVLLLVSVWLLPVLGFFLANKYGQMGWFVKKKYGGGESSVAQGFMEADAVFNPGVKHRTEIIQKKEVAFHQQYHQTDDVEKGNNKNDNNQLSK